MTRDEHEALLARLRGTWPGEWDHERVLVWVETLEPYPYPRALAAVRRMAEECEFPSVAAFTRFATGRNAAGEPEVIVEPGRMFLPGTGWVAEVGRPQDRPAVRAGARPVRRTGPEPVVVHLEEARHRLERSKRPPGEDP